MTLNLSSWGSDWEILGLNQVIGGNTGTWNKIHRCRVRKSSSHLWHLLGFHMPSAFILYRPLICPTVSRPLQRTLCPLSAEWQYYSTAWEDVILIHLHRGSKHWALIYSPPTPTGTFNYSLIWWPINPHSHRGSSFKKLAKLHSQRP